MDLTQWLVVFQPMRYAMLLEGPTEEEWGALGDHITFWQSMSDRGLVLLLGRTQTNGPETIGLGIFLAPSYEGAKQLVQADPAVRGGVFKGFVFPYKVAVLGSSEPFRP
ncbi:MAG: hypothetical protein MUC92_10480 [Fimbriimonadaceae bacterium]|jgi:uncharacterized protein YciI|nr:hypothetical protein [Fimbriimonadaceae bacterium]